MYSDIMRVASCHKIDVPLLPRLLSVAARIFTGIEIAPTARIGSGLLIRHGSGIVIEDGVCIGTGAAIFQGVGLGRRFSLNGTDGSPTLGDDVCVYAGAKVLGPVNIGNRCRIGANAVVLRSFPDDLTITGIPAMSVGTNFTSHTTTSHDVVQVVEPRLGERPVPVGAFASKPVRAELGASGAFRIRCRR